MKSSFEFFADWLEFFLWGLLLAHEWQSIPLVPTSTLPKVQPIVMPYPRPTPFTGHRCCNIGRFQTNKCTNELKTKYAKLYIKVFARIGIADLSASLRLDLTNILLTNFNASTLQLVRNDLRTIDDLWRKLKWYVFPRWMVCELLSVTWCVTPLWQWGLEHSMLTSNVLISIDFPN